MPVGMNQQHPLAGVILTSYNIASNYMAKVRGVKGALECPFGKLRASSTHKQRKINSIHSLVKYRLRLMQHSLLQLHCLAVKVKDGLKAWNTHSRIAVPSIDDACAHTTIHLPLAINILGCASSIARPTVWTVLIWPLASSLTSPLHVNVYYTPSLLQSSISTNLQAPSLPCDVLHVIQKGL